MKPTARRSPRATSWSLRVAIRQRRFPRALRIAPAEPPTGIDDLIDALSAANEASGHNGSGPGLDDRTLADLATGLWRARKRMLEPGTDRPRSEMRQAFRHVQSTWDALVGADVKIQDHDGDPFDTGLALTVLDFQPTAGLEREKVVETLRPSVYLRGRTIQLGQVIVGTPDEEGSER